MKHITGAEKSLLVGDEAADLLMEYASFLGNSRMVDTVKLRAFGVDGEEVTATFLLNEGTNILAESTRSQLPEPDNAEAVRYMRETIEAGSASHSAVPADPEDFTPTEQV
jgi:hypothetical protein